MKKVTLTAATLALSFCLSTAASAELMVCKTKGNSGAKGWIADDIFINFTEGEEEIQVLDGIIKHFNGDFLKARVR